MIGRRVLLSAFACDPYFGSDEEVGWQWARELSARGFDVTVLTRASHREAIEREVAKTGDCADVRFEYVDLPRLHKVTMTFNRRNHVYYYFWQWAAYRRALALHRGAPFDRVHHVTWVSFRQPSFMGLLGVPFIFGPVAGGDEIPRGYTSAFGWKPKLKEAVRQLANALVRIDPLMWLTFGGANQIFFTSAGHLCRVPAFARRKARVELAIGSAVPDAPPPRVRSAPPSRLLFVGRCIGLKGMDLGLAAFARVLKVRPDASLTIVGDGEDRARWQAASERLGVSDAVHWLGWLAKDEVQALYTEHDVLFYPSLRDSGGFVVLEALQCGMPVVCFRLGGPGVVVDETCGAAIEAQDDLDATLTAFSLATLATLKRCETAPELAAECIARARCFTWPALIDRIYSEASASDGVATADVALAEREASSEVRSSRPC